MVLRKKVQKVPVGLKQESYRANKKDSKGSHITEHPDQINQMYIDIDTKAKQVLLYYILLRYTGSFRVKVKSYRVIILAMNFLFRFS